MIAALGAAILPWLLVSYMTAILDIEALEY